MWKSLIFLILFATVLGRRHYSSKRWRIQQANRTPGRSRSRGRGIDVNSRSRGRRDSPAAGFLESFVQLKRIYECDWVLLDKSGRSALGGGGHSASECLSACKSAENCKYSAISKSGYCHNFETCDGEGKLNTWTVYKKISPTLEVEEEDSVAAGYQQHAWEFLDMLESFDQLKRIYECDWVLLDKFGRSALGGGGHSAKECLSACKSAENCKYSAISESGYCHNFETCDGKGKLNTWTVYKKKISSKVSLEEETSLCLNVLDTTHSDGELSCQQLCYDRVDAYDYCAVQYCKATNAAIKKWMYANCPNTCGFCPVDEEDSVAERQIERWMMKRHVEEEDSVAKEETVLGLLKKIFK